jgi:excisionase family DNA binding protein
MDNSTDYTQRYLLNAREAGELLGVPASWLLAEARRARVPHVRLGRYVRFNRETLLAWVAGHERGPVTSRKLAATSPAVRVAGT